jgi:hypothetical protein
MVPEQSHATRADATERRVWVERRATVVAQRLLVDGLDVDLAVRAKDAGPIDVLLQGTRVSVQAISVVCESGVLPTLRIGTSDAVQERIQIAVTVPLGCPLDLHGVSGHIVIGDTHGPLRLRATDFVQLRAGDVAAADVQVEDYGRIEISRIAAPKLTIGALESARLRVDGGNADCLDASVLGAGNILFMGAADDADLTVRGPGHISVGRVRRTLRRSILGSGDIHVAIPPRTDLTAMSLRRGAGDGRCEPIALGSDRRDRDF